MMQSTPSEIVITIHCSSSLSGEAPVYLLLRSSTDAAKYTNVETTTAFAFLLREIASPFQHYLTRSMIASRMSMILNLQGSFEDLFFDPLMESLIQRFAFASTAQLWIALETTFPTLLEGSYTQTCALCGHHPIPRTHTFYYDPLPSSSALTLDSFYVEPPVECTVPAPTSRVCCTQDQEWFRLKPLLKSSRQAHPSMYWVIADRSPLHLKAPSMPAATITAVPGRTHHVRPGFLFPSIENPKQRLLQWIKTPGSRIPVNLFYNAADFITLDKEFPHVYREVLETFLFLHNASVTEEDEDDDDGEAIVCPNAGNPEAVTRLASCAPYWRALYVLEALKVPVDPQWKNHMYWLPLRNVALLRWVNTQLTYAFICLQPYVSKNARDFLETQLSHVHSQIEAEFAKVVKMPNHLHWVRPSAQEVASVASERSEHNETALVSVLLHQVLGKRMRELSRSDMFVSPAKMFRQSFVAEQASPSSPWIVDMHITIRHRNSPAAASVASNTRQDQDEEGHICDSRDPVFERLQLNMEALQRLTTDSASSFSSETFPLFLSDIEDDMSVSRMAM